MKIALAILLVLSIGIHAIFFFSRKPISAAAGTPVSREEFSTNFPLLSYRAYAFSQSDLIINFVPLRTRLRELSSNQKFKHGIYFEYLPSGVPIGINASEVFYSASLIKVPLTMEVYKMMEAGVVNKRDRLTIEEKHIDPLYGTLWEKGAGHTLSVEDAIRATLTESDNTAARVLFETIPDGNINEVFDAVDIQVKGVNNHAVVSALEYSSILRSLYLSSYLTPKSSNEILDLLSHSVENDKLPAGIPEGVKISHKIGVYNPDDPETSVFSDCGIVYAPNRPFIMCAFAQTDEETARSFIKEVGKLTYDYVMSVNKK